MPRPLRGNAILIATLLVSALTVTTLGIARLLLRQADQERMSGQLLGAQAHACNMRAYADYARAIGEGTEPLPAAAPVAPVAVTFTDVPDLSPTLPPNPAMPGPSPTPEPVPNLAQVVVLREAFPTVDPGVPASARRVVEVRFSCSIRARSGGGPVDQVSRMLRTEFEEVDVQGGGGPGGSPKRLTTRILEGGGGL